MYKIVENYENLGNILNYKARNLCMSFVYLNKQFFLYLDTHLSNNPNIHY